MNLAIRFPAAFALLLTLLHAAPLRAEEPAPDTRDGIPREAVRRFDAGDWEGLESWAKSLRESRARVTDGLWQLALFYDGLDPDAKLKNEADWQRWFARLDAWKAAAPDSPTQPIVRAEALIHYAWKARGSGWASTVKAEGWKLFEERLAQARAVLEALPDGPGRCPHWAAAMQTVALGQGWERGEYDQLFEAAAKREPAYYTYYFRKAIYLLPRWHGGRGDWERFALDAAERLDRGEGMAVYARIAWSLESYHRENLFTETDITWERMRAGFRDLLKQFPASDWNRGAFGRYALQARDREVIREVLAGYGDRATPAAWGGPGFLAVARTWADPATPARQLNPAARLVRRGAPAVHSLAMAPDGRSLAAGYGDGRVAVWELPAGRVVWEDIVSPAGDPVTGVSFSPDGQLLAASAGEEKTTSHPGAARVWETAGERREVDRVTRFSGSVSRVAWTPDGRTLALMGGTYNQQGEGYFWNRETHETGPMFWPASHTHHIHALAYSPDGRTLAADCHRSLTVWDVAENLMRFESVQTLPTYTMAVAFSPDGKRLAAAGSPSWSQASRQPGTVILTDTTTWKELAAPRVDADTSGLECLAWSPDGRWLAAGGTDQGVHVWEAATMRPKTLYVGHTKTVRGVAWSPDGKTLASAAEDGAVLLWEAP